MGLKDVFGRKLKQLKGQQYQSAVDGNGSYLNALNAGTQPYQMHRGYYEPQPRRLQQQSGNNQRMNQNYGHQQLNDESPVSPIQPYGPDEVGTAQTFPSSAQNYTYELPGTGGRHIAQPTQRMSQQEYQSQQRTQQYRRDLADAQRKSEQVAERTRRAEVEKKIVESRRNASKESVRRLRDLVRQKYQLDLAIWADKDVLEADHELVLKDCRKADDVLQQIYDIVCSWDEHLFNTEDWKVAQKIKQGLLEDGLHVKWVNTPPWQFKPVPVQEIVSDDEWNEWNE